MKHQMSLKWFVALVFLSLGILLVVGYTFLSAQYFIRGMDGMIASNMEQIGKSHIDLLPFPETTPVKSFNGYQIAQHWYQLPRQIQQVFQQQPKVSGVMHKQADFHWPRAPKVIYFVMRVESQGKTLFVSSSISPETVSKLVDRNITESKNTLLMISAFSASILALTIWLLMRRISRPVAALAQWTRCLDSDQLTKQPPDFSYPELNELAELIRTSLSSVQQSLEREHRFLRFTSHELRTPISVIRNNIELIHKLQKTAEYNLTPRHLQVVQRIDRASLTMQHMTEILLWLSRDLSESLPEQRLSLEQLVQQLVDEMRYLLTDKNVQVELITEPYWVSLPEMAARIVLGNLIRNAFQHTLEGTVVIQQRHNRVEILNEQDERYCNDQDLGFGLGLQLTLQLTSKLGWTYENDVGPQGHRAVVIFAKSRKEINEPNGSTPHR